MQVQASLGRIDAELQRELRRIERATTAGMRQASSGLKDDLREQVRSAGLGPRMANTWRNETYPKGQDSLEPAAYVWSKAPKIVQAFAAGAVIVPKFGRFLALPTDDTPRKRAGGRAMTPEEVEDFFGRRLVPINPADKGFKTPSVLPRGSLYLVMNKLVVRKASGRWRKASARELSGTTRNPRPLQSVIMFVLVPRVRMPKLLELAGTAERWGRNASVLITAQIEGTG